MWSRHRLRRQSRISIPISTLRTSIPRPRFISGNAKPASPRSAAGVLSALVVGSAATVVYQKWTTSDKPASATTASPEEVSSGKVPKLDSHSKSASIDFGPVISSEDVTRMISQGASSYLVDGDAGIIKYDVAQVGSNSPCEDAYLHGSFSDPLKLGIAKDWMAWAVFDGHCGSQLSELLTTNLLPHVCKELESIEAVNGAVPDAAIQEAIKSSFTKLDDELVKTASAIIDSDLSYPEKIKKLIPAFAGSCALLALYNPSASSLHIASTGDCRAVLGRKTADGKWEATFVTIDQTGANPDEIARIQAQFPDEPDLVKGGRIWGMQPSRTFGDGGWKWDIDLRRRLRVEYNACKLPSSSRYSAYKQGPYLTAAPVVSTVKIDRDGPPSFLILATDGLWDTMTSEEAVDLVGRWSDMKQHPSQLSAANGGMAESGPIKLGAFGCTYSGDRATFQDPNAAVHLIRNGLGGANDEMIRGALTFPSSMSRDIRDDMTVQVVFFEGKQ
ncbi:phosphatase 2C-like domain-containing protein [Xylariales sp. PMI_506]|nr:phosphatase 2C-like domain-containing protein [Xylariales sp. PMI_506]